MAFTSRFLPAALSLALTRQHPGYIKGGVALSLSLLSCRSAGLSSTAAARGDEKTPSDGVILHRGVTLLGQEAAAALDVDLMQEPDGFKLEQLMELAGLSVATAFVEAFPTSDETPTRVVVVCGPGNNGGDGLVAARHLHHFGYPVTVVVPKPGRNPYFRNLEQQCRDLGINVLSDLQAASRKDNDGDRCGTLVQHFDVVIDAMFGFSFKGAPRPPFDDIIAILNRDQALPSSSSLASSSSPGLRILSVDIPSGWDVEAGDLTGKGLRPDVLVSLTAPKLCAKQLSSSSSARTVRHFLGGRFVPPHIRDKYGLVLPKYPGASQCVELKDW